MPPLTVEIYAFQTASFVVLGVIAALLPRSAEQLPYARHFGWLAGFGLWRGALGMVHLWTLSRLPAQWETVSLLVSFLFLFEFARRLVNEYGGNTSADWTRYTTTIVYVPIVVGLLAMFATDGWLAFRAGARYLVALPGGVGAAWVMHRTFPWPEMARLDRRLARGFVATLAGYGLLAGLLIDSVAGLPAWFLTAETARRVIGAPVALLQAADIALVSITLGTLVHRAYARAMSDLRRNTRALETLATTLESRVAERTADLEQQQKFAQQLLDVTPAVILVLSAEGRIQHVNPAFERLTGWRLAEVRGQDWLEHLPANDRPRIGELFRAAVGGSQTRGNVNPILTRTGEQREIEWYDQVLRNDIGNVTDLIAVGIDVTDRRRAEHAAEALRQRQRSILDGMFAFVGLFGLDGTVLEANQAPLEAAGIERGEVIGRLFWETYWWSHSPATQAQVRSALARAARGEIVREDFVTRVAGERFITIDAMFGPLRDANGTIVEVIGSAVDVTDRKRNERALRESEARLRAIFESGPECIKIVARDGTLVDMNPAGQRLIGASTLDTVRNRPVIDLIDPEYHAQYQEGMASVLRGETTQQQFEIVALDGQRRWMDQHAVPMRDPSDSSRVVAMLAVTRDITSRRQMEAELQRSEARLRQAQSIAVIGNWELEIASGTLWWSDEIYRIFEVDQPRFRVSYEAFLDTIHPDDRETVNAAYTASLQTRSPYQITHRIQTAAGRVKYVEERCETDFGPGGMPVRSRGTVQEITVRVMAEEALRASVREKETLLREVHHRVKNNLQIVSSLLHFQARRVKHPDDLAAFADARNRLRAMSLVHEKLYRSSDLSAIDMHEYLQDLMTGVRHSHQVASRCITIELTAAPLRLSVETAMPAGMIVSELLTNVFKHAFPADRRDGRVEVSLTVSGSRAEIGVTDNGVGLPESFSPESSESFGWQLIRALAEQLDGELRVARARGTSVVVSFPKTG